MVSRLTKAACRAVVVSIFVALPAVMLPMVQGATLQTVFLLAIAAAVLVFFEYVSDYPSLIEFRDAPPFNRIRFALFFMLVLTLTLIEGSTHRPNAAMAVLNSVGAAMGSAMDFALSPVHLMIIALPETTPKATLDLFRTMAGLAYLMTILTLVLFAALVRLLDWPLRNGAFNFWVNLPLFDPTTGGDVVYRLKRDSHVNVALGFLLPFLLPALLMLYTSWGIAPNFEDHHTMIWMVIAWSFLPACLIMRGIALMRIAELIAEKRRRAYAQSDFNWA